MNSKKTLRIAKARIRNKDTGKETVMNDSLHYGMGLYAYAQDVIDSGCKYETGKNPLFFHLIPEINNVSNYVSFMNNSLS